jgi:hypothetical protein
MIKNILLIAVLSCYSIAAMADGHSNQYVEPKAKINNKDKTTPQILIPRNQTSLAIRIPCDTTEYIIDFLIKEHNEKVLFDAEGIVYGIPEGRPPAFAQPLKMNFTVYVNQETGKWSFVGHSNGFSCLMTNGDDFVAGGHR